MDKDDDFYIKQKNKIHKVVHIFYEDICMLVFVCVV